MYYDHNPQDSRLGQMSLHICTYMWQGAVKRAVQVEKQRVKSATLPRQNNLFSAHIPMWRLSRLQNLAISPLATILLSEEQSHSEKGWGVTEHHRTSHRLSVTETAEIAYSLLGRCVHSQPSLLRNWQLTRSSVQLRLAAPHITLAGRRKFYTKAKPTHTKQRVRCGQEPSMKTAENLFAAFNYNPKARVWLRELLKSDLFHRRNSS